MAQKQKGVADAMIKADYCAEFLCTWGRKICLSHIVYRKRALFHMPSRSVIAFRSQYLCQLREAEGGLRGMNTPQTSDLVENLT